MSDEKPNDATQKTAVSADGMPTVSVSSSQINITINDDSGNKYLLMNFVEFAIVSTLMVTLFPWSLIYCLIVYGMEQTKLLVVALLHDLTKTFLAILSIVVPILIVVVLIILSYKKVI